MRCEEIRRLLDEDAPLDREAAEHLIECEPCRKEVAASQAVRRELRAMGSDPAPPFLHARIMAHVRAETARPRRGWATRFRLALAPALVLAAFAIVVVGGGSFWLLRQRVAAPDLGFEGRIRQDLEKRNDTGEVPAPAVQPLELQSDAKLTVKTSAPLRKAESPRPALKEDAPRTAPAPPQPATLAAATAAPALPEVTDRVAGGAAVPMDEWAQTHQHPSQSTSALPVGVPSPGLAGTVRQESQPAPGKGAEAGRDKDQVYGSSVATAGAAETEKRAQTESQAPTAAVESEESNLTLACTVTPESGGEPIWIGLPPELAPPPGQRWRIEVTTDGAMRLTTATDGRIAPSLARALTDRLVRLRLAPGRFRLVSPGSQRAR